jgi:hypothetical protein
VEESVMERAGVTPESEAVDAEAPAAESKEGGDRLSVFKDFVEGLDMDDLSGGEENKS